MNAMQSGKKEKESEKKEKAEKKKKKKCVLNECVRCQLASGVSSSSIHARQ